MFLFFDRLIMLRYLWENSSCSKLNGFDNPFILKVIWYQQIKLLCKILLGIFFRIFYFITKLNFILMKCNKLMENIRCLYFKMSSVVSHRAVRISQSRYIPTTSPRAGGVLRAISPLPLPSTPTLPHGRRENAGSCCHTQYERCNAIFRS